MCHDFYDFKTHWLLVSLSKQVIQAFSYHSDVSVNTHFKIFWANIWCQNKQLIWQLKASIVQDILFLTKLYIKLAACKKYKFRQIMHTQKHTPKRTLLKLQNWKVLALNFPSLCFRTFKESRFFRNPYSRDRGVMCVYMSKGISVCVCVCGKWALTGIYCIVNVPIY